MRCFARRIKPKKHSVPWEVIKFFVKPGQRVAEFFHGEKPDVLRGLAKLVGKNGMVYGIDRYNPKIVMKAKLPPHVILYQAEIPNLPLEVKDLDVVVIREFEWSWYENGKPLPNRYQIAQSIYFCLRQGAYLIVHDPLGLTEKQRVVFYTKLVSDLYQARLTRVYPTESNTQSTVLVFQKQ